MLTDQTWLNRRDLLVSSHSLLQKRVAGLTDSKIC